MANWYIRKGGADTNGGSSSSLTPDRSGTDGVVTNASTAFVSASAAFTAGDVGKGICIATVQHRIATYTNATTVQLDRIYAGTTGISKAWAIGGALLTINRVTNITNTTVFQAGDNVYIGPGVYREVIACGQSYSGSQLNMIGDTDGSHTGGTGGEVQITAYTTNDKTAPSSSPLISFSTTTTNFWSFSNIVFIGGNGNPRIFSPADNTNFTFTNCAFIAVFPSNTVVISFTYAVAATKNWLFDRCRFFMRGSISFTLPTHASADYDANVVFKNCCVDTSGGNAGFDIAGSGALSFKGGGLYFYNCTIQSSGTVIRTTGAITSTTYPVKVENCVILGPHSGTGLSVVTAGTMTEQYNIINAATPRAAAGPTVGTGSISNGSYAPLYSIGQESIWGGQPRPMYAPTAGSPILGFGASANAPTVDISNTTRPFGGASASYAAGALERPNTFVKETTTTHTGSNSLKAIGPAIQEFLIPVSATSTTVTVFLRYDSTYAGTRPQLVLTNGTECGVADQTITASTSALNAWESNSVTFTPTANGIVTIRIVSRDTNGGGACYVDSFAVS